MHLYNCMDVVCSQLTEMLAVMALVLAVYASIQLPKNVIWMEDDATSSALMNH